MTQSTSRLVYALVLLVLAMWVSSPLHAEGPQLPTGHGEQPVWILHEVSGSVRYREAGSQRWKPAVAGDILGTKGTLESGANGRATLARGEDTIVVYPDTRFQVRPAGADGLGALIEQTLGKLFIDVETVPGRIFSVETPYLVAGVTGTTFIVEITRGAATVAVQEGIVSVTRADRRGEVKRLEAGETFRVQAAANQPGLMNRGQQGGSAGSTGTRLRWDNSWQPPRGSVGGLRHTLDWWASRPGELLAVVGALALIISLLPRAITSSLVLGASLLWLLPTPWLLAALTFTLPPVVLLWRRWRSRRRGRTQA